MIYADAGINLPEGKAALVYARLAKRLRALRLEAFRDYCELVRIARRRARAQEMLAALTTNVTRFYPRAASLRASEDARAARRCCRRRARGGTHPHLVGGLLERAGALFDRADDALAVAGGRRATTCAMLATDIDPHMLAAGGKGVYSERRLEGVPADQRKRFFETATRRRQARMARRRGDARAGRVPAAQPDRILADARDISTRSSAATS